MEATSTGGGNVISLGTMIHLEKRKKLEAVSHPSTSLTEVELTFADVLRYLT